MKIRKLYRMRGAYGYVEVTQHGHRCFEYIMFSAGEPELWKGLGYTFEQLSAVTDYFSVKAGPLQEIKPDAGQPKAGQLPAVKETVGEVVQGVGKEFVRVLFARRGDDPWFVWGVIDTDDTQLFMLKNAKITVLKNEVAAFEAGQVLFAPSSGFDRWVIRNVRVELPA